MSPRTVRLVCDRLLGWGWGRDAFFDYPNINNYFTSICVRPLEMLLRNICMTTAAQIWEDMDPVFLGMFATASATQAGLTMLTLTRQISQQESKLADRRGNCSCTRAISFLPFVFETSVLPDNVEHVRHTRRYLKSFALPSQQSATRKTSRVWVVQSSTKLASYMRLQRWIRWYGKYLANGFVD
jgi:hypothetical protein